VLNKIMGFNLTARVLGAWRSAYELDARAMEYLDRECWTQRSADRPTKSGVVHRLGASAR
jgi:hypothetical protein